MEKIEIYIETMTNYENLVKHFFFISKILHLIDIYVKCIGCRMISISMSYRKTDRLTYLQTGKVINREAPFLNITSSFSLLK